MSKVIKRFYIKERYNPQLGTYYVKCGQMSKAEAKRNEKPLYGQNVMWGYDDEQTYNNAIKGLEEKGNRVQ